LSSERRLCPFVSKPNKPFSPSRVNAYEKTKPIYPKRGRTEVSEAGCDSRQHELIGRMKPKFLNFAAKIV
jgi:hypothetical protein